MTGGRGDAEVEMRNQGSRGLDRELGQSLSLILMTAVGVCAYLGLGLLAVRVFG
jgi:hypothetical protein